MREGWGGVRSAKVYLFLIVMGGFFCRGGGDRWWVVMVAREYQEGGKGLWQ